MFCLVQKTELPCEVINEALSNSTFETAEETIQFLRSCGLIRNAVMDGANGEKMIGLRCKKWDEAVLESKRQEIKGKIYSLFEHFGDWDKKLATLVLDAFFVNFYFFKDLVDSKICQEEGYT